MFSKQQSGKRPASPHSAPATGARQIPFSLIGSDVTVTGNIDATVDLHIDGRVEGDIRCASLVQGPDSRIKGQVTAKTARIAGTVEGSIFADELIVDASARIVGDVSYATISIAAGGQIAGQFAHKDGVQTGTDLRLIKNEG